uniref:Tig_0 protein n=1 Tax=Fopius arisanus TaxID=64838 RepID=A0A0C9QJ80_9HYME
MHTVVHKGVIIILVMSGTIILTGLVTKTRKNDIILEMMANVSRNIDKLEAGIDAINSETEIAKTRFQKLIGIQRERLLECFFRRNEREKDKSTFTTSSPGLP